MIIAISGKIGSGKDTVGKIIRLLASGMPSDAMEWSKENMDDLNNKEAWNPIYFDKPNSWQIKKFAYKLKQIVSILTGIPVEDLEKQEVKDRLLATEWDKIEKVIEVTSTAFDLANMFGYNFDELEKTKVDPIERGKIRNQCLNEAVKNGWEQVEREKYVLYTKKRTPRTVRWLLQNVGTEAMRNHIHENIWVNALFADYVSKVSYACDRCMKDNINLIEIESRFKEQGCLENEFVCENCKGEESEGDITKIIENTLNWVITDLRFPNELKAVEDRDGITIRVECSYIRQGDAKATRVPSEHGEHPSETALDNATFKYIIDNSGTIEELVEKVKEILILEKII